MVACAMQRAGREKGPAPYSNMPVVEPHDAIHLRREPLVVRGDQRGAALAADEGQEFGEHAVRRSFVEVAGRFVGEHQRRAVGERAGDRDALLLAARQFGRAVVETLAEPERAEQAVGAFDGLRARCAADHLRQHDILARVEIGQQVVELVDEAQGVAAQRGAPVIVEARGFLAGDTDRAFEPAFEQPDRLEQGRLARPRRPEQRDDLARLDRQADPAQDMDGDIALRERALEVADVETGSVISWRNKPVLLELCGLRF